MSRDRPYHRAAMAGRTKTRSATGSSETARAGWWPYWLFTEHPGDGYRYGSWISERFPASRVISLFRRERPISIWNDVVRSDRACALGQLRVHEARNRGGQDRQLLHRDGEAGELGERFRRYCGRRWGTARCLRQSFVESSSADAHSWRRARLPRRHPKRSSQLGGGGLASVHAANDGGGAGSVLHPIHGRF